MNQAFKRHIAALALYTVLTLLMTLPVVFRLNTHVAGTGGDPWQTLWRFTDKANQLKSALHQGQVSHFIATELLGQGDPQLVNLSVWPWMPLHLIFGEPTAYNLIWLLSFILSGYAMYLLTSWLFREYGAWENEATALQRQLPAFLAGMMYMFLPYHVAQAQGHFGAMQLQWLPFILLAGFYWLKRPAILKSVLLAALIIIQAWTEHHYLLWLVLFGIVFGLFNRQQRMRAVKRAWLPLGVMILLAALGIFLSYAPTIKLAAQPTSRLALGQEQTIRFSADPFAYVTPASFHPLWGQVFDTVYSRFFTGNLAEATHFLGFVPLLLSLFFHQQIPRQQKKFWLVIGAIFFIISLGPRLHLMGRVTPLRLPYAMIDSWPIFNTIRAVARASVMVSLATTILFGWVLQTQMRRVGSAVAVGILILIEFLFMPVPMQSAVLNPAYAAIQALPGKSLVEIPAATNYILASRSLYASTIHGKQVLGSIALERANTDQIDASKAIPGLRQLLYVRTGSVRKDRLEFFGQDLTETTTDALRLYGVAAILVHPDSLDALQQATVKNFLEKELRLTGIHYDDTILYPVDSSRLPTSDGVMLHRDAGWSNVGYDAKRNSYFAEVGQRATVTINNLNQTARAITLFFERLPDNPSELTIRVNGQPQSGTFTVPPGETVVEFSTTSPRPVILKNPTMHVSNE